MFSKKEIIALIFVWLVSIFEGYETDLKLLKKNKRILCKS